MKHKLSTFSEFVNQLFPHEADYLMRISKFSKGDNQQILAITHYNCYHQENRQSFDPEMDKRSYSYIKNWITEALDKVDVDKFYDWLLLMEKKVMTDSILPDEEKQILNNYRTIDSSHYYFLRFYELVQYYRDYLLIRVRNKLYKPTNDYLVKHEAAYLRGQAVNKQLNQATVEIIRQHETFDADPIYFKNFLHETFTDTMLDGYTRYRSAVRLTFLYYNYREFENLRSVYDALDELFKGSVFYSKRTLANYYSNRSMMHSKLNELELAEYYSYLAIRHKNSDYLFYLANLCGILLKSQKYAKALKLMSDSIPDLKRTNSFYNKIGFVSFYIRTLLYNNKAKNAVSYASTFLDAYRKEIFETRWHLFFSAYMQALMSAEKFSQILTIEKRYNLLSMEKKFIETTVYTPNLLWYHELALYMEGRQPKEQLKETILNSASSMLHYQYKSGRAFELLNQLSEFIPTEVAEIKLKLKRKTEKE